MHYPFTTSRRSLAKSSVSLLYSTVINNLPRLRTLAASSPRLATPLPARSSAMANSSRSVHHPRWHDRSSSRRTTSHTPPQHRQATHTITASSPPEEAGPPTTQASPRAQDATCLIIIINNNVIGNIVQCTRC